MKEFVVDLFRERRAEHGDRRGEHQPRLVAVAGVADRLDQMARAVEIDPIALVELGLRLAGDDGREMEDHVRPVGEQAGGGARIGKVGGNHLDRHRRLRRLLGRDDVLQLHP